jgi:hypothetical protein
MTQDEIIEMARQAGCFEQYQVFYFTSLELEAFAKLVAAKERKAIAFYFANNWADEYTDVEIVAAIRSRGET